jgi:hypothetical protein
MAERGGGRELPDVPALRVLEPPPGGLARVRDAIDHEQARAGQPRWWLAVAPLAFAAVLLILLTGRPPRSSHAIADAPVTAAAPLADPAVGAQFYWVASQPAGVAHAVAPVRLSYVDSTGSPPVALMP